MSLVYFLTAQVAQRAQHLNGGPISLETAFSRASIVGTGGAVAADHPPPMPSMHSSPAGLGGLGAKGGSGSGSLASRRKGIKFNIHDITGAPPPSSFGARNAGLGGGIPVDNFAAGGPPARRHLVGASPFDTLVKNKVV